jgi:glutathione S-transferase
MIWGPMMKLYMSANSPYARKVRVLLAEMGKAQDVEEISVNPRDATTGFWEVNAVAKIPTLELDDGRAIGESDLISHYLLTTTRSADIFRCKGIERLSALALANGVLDTGMAARVEKTRPGAEDTDAFVAKNLNAVSRAFDALEVCATRDSDTPDLADIALVCAVDWISLRHPEVTVTENRPSLAKRVAQLSQRPSFKSTVPG